jgi:hypothetical protein
MVRDRLDFYIDENPVGHFLWDGYPTNPGRYRYDPYRGVGHLLMKEALKRGTAECWFTDHERRFRLLITSEEFILGKPASQWFVNVSEILE